MLSFIGEIPWENTMVNPIPWVRKTVDQHIPKKIPPNPKAGGMSVQYTWGTNTTE